MRADRPSKQQTDALRTAFREGRFADALDMARALCDRFPSSLSAWNLRGACARALGRLEEAEASFCRLETLDPAFAGAPYNLGLVLEDLGRVDEAMAAYSRAIAIDPGMAQAHNNLGGVLTRRGELDAAITHLETACSLSPQMPEVHNSLGNALKRAERYADAAHAYKAAITAAPGYVKALYNLGVLMQEQGDASQAVALFEKVLALEPDHALARCHLVYQLARHCDWERLADHESAIPDLGVTTQGVPPWPLLAFEDAPARQLSRSRNWARLRFGLTSQTGPDHSIPAQPKSRPERLKLAYFSGDFHDHPSMHLMAGLLASHDRARFEVHAFSYGEQREDEYRRKARQCVDHFHDVARQSDQAIVDLAHGIGLDIAIDRKGYSAGTRNQLFQHRLAPVQINYLAYPGTLGAPFIDYIVGDPIVTPPTSSQHFSESVICLPDTYQPNDNTRAIAPIATSRADFGLPENAFVFCCFNATYKITAREFDIWMRVMGRVEGSVLWLFASNREVQGNLREQARRRGVDPARLIFAQALPNASHLARHVHADLFLDTFAVNAHTTASDALWTGLPLVTLIGEQFAARVAASLLHAIGLPELIVHSAHDYEALILALATDRGRLAEVKAKLVANREAMPLFDTQLYTRHFEAGLNAAYDRYFDGLAPASIVVERFAGNDADR